MANRRKYAKRKAHMMYMDKSMANDLKRAAKLAGVSMNAVIVATLDRILSDESAIEKCRKWCAAREAESAKPRVTVRRKAV